MAVPGFQALRRPVLDHDAVRTERRACDLSEVIATRIQPSERDPLLHSRWVGFRGRG